ncbi:unnamed protein product [Trichogramma brassicae]|uniref:Uncharacterized protein n=1 Tax=Trichogramma brassicae TaxID=86971 RepID=A0A6H5IP48_9HYME|nr:unnamed protein product [Trichogramma brassicae]
MNRTIPLLAYIFFFIDGSHHYLLVRSRSDAGIEIGLFVLVERAPARIELGHHRVDEMADAPTHVVIRGGSAHLGTDVTGRTEDLVIPAVRVLVDLPRLGLRAEFPRVDVQLVIAIVCKIFLFFFSFFLISRLVDESVKIPDDPCIPMYPKVTCTPLNNRAARMEALPMKPIGFMCS